MFDANYWLPSFCVIVCLRRLYHFHNRFETFYLACLNVFWNLVHFLRSSPRLLVPTHLATTIPMPTFNNFLLLFILIHQNIKRASPSILYRVSQQIWLLLWLIRKFLLTSNSSRVCFVPIGTFAIIIIQKDILYFLTTTLLNLFLRIRH